MKLKIQYIEAEDTLYNIESNIKYIEGEGEDTVYSRGRYTILKVKIQYIEGEDTVHRK